MNQKHITKMRIKKAMPLLPALALALLPLVAYSNEFRSCSLPGSLSKYDLVDLAKQGPMSICIENDTFSRYDLTEMAEALITLNVATASTKYSKMELVEMARAGKLVLRVDSDRLSKFDLIEIVQAKAKVVLMLSSTKYSKYDLSDIAMTFARLENADARLEIMADSDRLSIYDLVELSKSKANVRLMNLQKYSKYDIEEVLRAGGTIGAP